MYTINGYINIFLFAGPTSWQNMYRTCCIPGRFGSNQPASRLAAGGLRGELDARCEVWFIPRSPRPQNIRALDPQRPRYLRSWASRVWLFEAPSPQTWITGTIFPDNPSSESHVGGLEGNGIQHLRYPLCIVGCPFSIRVTGSPSASFRDDLQAARMDSRGSPFLF